MDILAWILEKKKGISLTNRNFDKEVKKKILANKSYFRFTQFEGKGNHSYINGNFKKN